MAVVEVQETELHMNRKREREKKKINRMQTITDHQLLHG
jgi:hypothetical protein